VLGRDLSCNPFPSAFTLHLLSTGTWLVRLQNIAECFLLMSPLAHSKLVFSSLPLSVVSLGGQGGLCILSVIVCCTDPSVPLKEYRSTALG
jgi:hypothetical protein